MEQYFLKDQQFFSKTFGKDLEEMIFEIPLRDYKT